MSNRRPRPRDPIARLRELADARLREQAGRLNRADKPGALVFYSANCTYWHDMTSFGEQMHAPATPEMPAAGRVPGEVPRCPYCGSPGYQGDLTEFIATIDAQAEPERTAWHRQRGHQCHRTREEMLMAYTYVQGTQPT